MAVRRARPVVAPAIRAAPGRRPLWGNLRRVRPFSACYGFDRGLPIDRVYIERFLDRHRADVAGDVLEVRDAEYTRRFGGESVRARHVLDVEAGNREATFLGDVCRPGVLPESALDCALLTQVLPYVTDVDAALRNVWQALRPGAVLLVTVPCVARVDPHARDSDRWRMTPLGLEQWLARCCPASERDVTGHGNLVSAVAFLLGLAAQELTEDELALDDPSFPVVACGRVRKPGPAR